MNSMYSETVVRLPDECFPKAFHADVAAYSDWVTGRSRMAGPPPTGRTRRRKSFNSPKPICALTLRGRASIIYLAASAVARSGREPSAITSIADVACPEALRILLEEIAGRARVRAASRNESYATKDRYSATVAQRMRSIALSWCDDLFERKAEYTAIIARVRPKKNIQDGMSRKNADRLKQFASPDVLRRWFELPDLLVQRAEVERIKRKRVTRCMVADVQTSVALALLQNLPMRGINLARLRIGKHPNIVFGREGANLFIRGEEVKNKRDLSAQIGGRALAILLLYVTRYLPEIRERVGAHRDNPFLFPAKGLTEKSVLNISANIVSRASSVCGLRLNLHLLRHLAAKIIVDRAPREVGVASGLLGHARQETTERFYLSPDKTALGARYRSLVDPAGADENGSEMGASRPTWRRKNPGTLMSQRDVISQLRDRLVADPRLLEVARGFGYEAPPPSEETEIKPIARQPTKLVAAHCAFRLFAEIDGGRHARVASRDRRIAEAVERFVTVRRQRRRPLTLLSNLEGLTLAFRVLGLDRESEFLRRYTRMVRHETCFPGNGARKDPNAWRNFYAWPPNDRDAWLQLVGPESKPASSAESCSGCPPRWSTATQRTVYEAYSRFLRVIGAAGMPARITPDSVQTFMDALSKKGLSAGSILSGVRNVYEAARVVAADENLTWLRCEVNRLKHLATREIGRRDLGTIDPAQIWLAGRALISRARATGETDFGTFLLFRDGLIFCMATAVPIRSGLWHRFIVHEGELFFDVPDGDTKPVDLQHWPELAEDVREFVNRHRILLLPAYPERALWLSAMGKPLSRRQFAYIFKERSTQLLGSPVSAEALRAGVIQLFLSDAPEHVGDAAIVLGYYGTAVQERLRARASQLISQQKALRLIETEMRFVADHKTPQP